MNAFSCTVGRPVRAFTLVEMLAVVMIFALAASVAMVSLARSDRSGAMERAGSEIMRMDALARLSARSGGSAVSFILLDHGPRQRIEVRSGAAGEVIAAADLPSGLMAAISTTGDASGAHSSVLRIDRSGRSADAQVSIVSDEGSRRKWMICGLTGQFTRLVSEEEGR